jgi:peptidoglycan/xylan/chitin deacetylase (PgdA/CDA1 family)
MLLGMAATLGAACAPSPVPAPTPLPTAVPTAAPAIAVATTVPTPPPTVAPTRIPPTAVPPTPVPPTATPIVPTPIPVPRANATLPIVMFHYTGPLPQGPDTLRVDLTVEPERFEQMLARFKGAGVTTVHLDRLQGYLAGTMTLPPRAAVLTFDDGYADNFEYAVPLLVKYGMVGTFFVTTGFTGRSGYMTAVQLRELADAGMSVQAHSVTHSDMTRVTPAQLRRELVEPRQRLEETIGRPVRFLAYPSGRYNSAVLAAARDAGYEVAVTTSHAHNHASARMLDLGRVRARGTDTADALLQRMSPPSWRTG